VRALVLLGPNLGALGRRDPKRYGSETFQDVRAGLVSSAAGDGHEAVVEQSDDEGELVRRLLAAKGEGFHGVLLNPGALTHYSHALRDAVEASELPVIEVHQTNIYTREGFRRHSVVSPACRAVVVGLGTRGYHLALEALAWITG
jgi:3-dehydroquinate dehydratase II